MLKLSPTIQRAFDSFAKDHDGNAMIGTSHPLDCKRFYEFVRVCRYHHQKLSSVEISQLLRDVRFPKNEADEWGSIFHHCYGVLCTPIPRFAISRERDEILRGHKGPYQNLPRVAEGSNLPIKLTVAYGPAAYRLARRFRC